jgi:hypothetical protein
MSVAVYKLVRITAVVLLLVSVPGFLPAAAHAQHSVRLRASAPAEDGPPGKSEEVSTDAYHFTLSKRLRSPRSRVKTRHFLTESKVPLNLVPSQTRLLRGVAFTGLTDPFAAQTTPLRC